VIAKLGRDSAVDILILKAAGAIDLRFVEEVEEIGRASCRERV